MEENKTSLVGGVFINSCVDIVEIGRLHKVEVTKVYIEGVYGGEIFRFPYVPEEEGYDTE